MVIVCAFLGKKLFSSFFWFFHTLLKILMEEIFKLLCKQIWGDWIHIGKWWVVITVFYQLHIYYEAKFEVSFCVVDQLDSYLPLQNKAWSMNKILVFCTLLHIGVCEAEQCVVSSHFIWNLAFLSNFSSLCLFFIYFQSFVIEYVSVGNYTKCPCLKAYWAGLDL